MSTTFIALSPVRARRMLLLEFMIHRMRVYGARGFVNVTDAFTTWNVSAMPSWTAAQLREIQALHELAKAQQRNKIATRSTEHLAKAPVVPKLPPQWLARRADAT